MSKYVNPASRKELSAEAGITMRTFYNHFTDKYAAVAWFMELSGAGSFVQIGLTATPQEALNPYAHRRLPQGKRLTCNPLDSVAERQVAFHSALILFWFIRRFRLSARRGAYG